MNNYEHIVQGGVDGFIGWALLYGCYRCSYSPNECERYCIEGQRKWLEAEYIEPDSWDKLLEDLERTAKGDTLRSYAVYFDCDDAIKVGKCKECNHYGHCTSDAFADVASRIRKLRDAE